MDEYQVRSPENCNFNPNSVLRINVKNTSIAEIPRKSLDEISEKMNLVNGKTEGLINSEVFKEYAREVNTFIRERTTNLIHVREKQENAGFAFISLIMIVGLLGIIFTMFLTINNLIH